MLLAGLVGIYGIRVQIGRLLKSQYCASTIVRGDRGQYNVRASLLCVLGTIVSC